jgi:hypothetical protein
MKCLGVFVARIHRDLGDLSALGWFGLTAFDGNLNATFATSKI